MDGADAVDDLKVIRRVLEGTHRRIDPHLFHFIVWGGVVLVWYPLVNVLELAGRGDRVGIVCGAAIGVGVLLSAVLGFLAGRHPRLPAGNALMSRQIGGIVAAFIVPGVLLSGTLPAIQRGGEVFIPHVWGFLYALMLLVLGIVYSREFLGFGLFIFVASVAALAAMRYSGFILGGAMGLGMIIPGIMAERRVARMIRETPDELP
jgi:hypothetical protein